MIKNLEELNSLFKVHKFEQKSKDESEFVQMFGDPDSYRIEIMNELTFISLYKENSIVCHANLNYYHKDADNIAVSLSAGADTQVICFSESDCPELYQIIEELELYKKLSDIKYQKYLATRSATKTYLYDKVVVINRVSSYSVTYTVYEGLPNEGLYLVTKYSRLNDKDTLIDWRWEYIEDYHVEELVRHSVESLCSDRNLAKTDYDNDNKFILSTLKTLVSDFYLSEFFSKLELDVLYNRFEKQE